MAQTFEEKTEALQKLAPEEYAKRIAEIKKVCRGYCGECPTYAGTGGKELGFCVTGKSKVVKEANGCLCAACPVTGDLSLRWQYYCIRGSGSEQASSE